MKLLALLRKMIYSGRTKGLTEKRINVAVDMSRSTFGCIRSKHVCFPGLGVAYTRPAEAVSSVLGLWNRVAEAGSSTDRENRHLKISRLFGTKLSQAPSRRETEARCDWQRLPVYTYREK